MDSGVPQPPWRIAIVHPTFWPYVRRGTERFMAEWSTRLAALGHHVTILTSKHGPPETTLMNGLQVRYLRSLWSPAMARFGVHDFHVFPLGSAPALLSSKFDLIHTFNFTDTLCASWLKPIHRAKVLLHVNTIPPTIQYRRTLSTGGRLLRAAIRAADQLLVISQQQQDYFEQRFGRPCLRIPAPVDTNQFLQSKEPNPAHPTLLCASALNDGRKGGKLLMRAFNQLKLRYPKLRLQIVFPLSESLRTELLSLVEAPFRPDVLFSTAENDKDLASAYSRASVLVLPSLYEAFPLVVLEALASGTPVVGANDGGIPEMLAPNGTGALFSPGEPDNGSPSNLSGLVEATERALQLSIDTETPARCRQAADRYSWDRLTPAYIQLYSNLIGDN